MWDWYGQSGETIYLWETIWSYWGQLFLWLSLNFLMTFSWFSHDFLYDYLLTNNWGLFHVLLITCSMRMTSLLLSHVFSWLFHNFLMTIGRTFAWQTDRLTDWRMDSNCHDSHFFPKRPWQPLLLVFCSTILTCLVVTCMQGLKKAKAEKNICIFGGL